ncbi:MAG: AMP-binding protein [Elusimicrobiaceae bacterium]|nr:AMP-binding protein [Elusimicrobiaceae bacterium]
MFAREQVEWIVHDIISTELVKQRHDTFAFFDTSEKLDIQKIPAEVLQQATKQVGLFFGFKPEPFSALSQLISQAHQAYQKNKFVYLSTSGSTGNPKQILYTQEMLEIEGKSVGRHFKNAKRLITLTPRQHLYGISFAVLFPFVYKTPTCALAALPVQPWESILQSGDVLAGFPLFWEYFLQAGNRFPPGVTAVTSTAPCPQGLFVRLQQAGAEHVVELYGATDTGGIGVREDESEPFQINDFWEVDATHQPVLIHRKGIEGWVPFPDQVKFVAPRGIFPLKRMDRVVQVAGVNVSLDRVEKILQQHPAVKTCKIRLMRPEEGKRLKAFVVLNAQYTEQILPQLRSYLTGQLSSHEMPRAFTFGAALPTNSMGKDSDW